MPEQNYSYPILIGLTMQAQVPLNSNLPEGRAYLKIRVMPRQDRSGKTFAVTRDTYDEVFAEALAHMRVTQGKRSIPKDWWKAKPDFDTVLRAIGITESVKYVYTA